MLIDEYDKPILDKIGDLEAAEAMREALRSFYTVLEDYDSHLRFVMLTGISKFTKIARKAEKASRERTARPEVAKIRASCQRN